MGGLPGFVMPLIGVLILIAIVALVLSLGNSGFGMCFHFVQSG